MRRFPAAPLFLALLVAGFASPLRAAPKSLENEVRARQRTAHTLAAKGQWQAAFSTLAAARDRINAERRKASAPPRRPLPAALQREATALKTWLAANTKSRKPGEPIPAAVATEYRRRHQALRQKIAKANPQQSESSARQASLKYGLLLADLDDTGAALHQRKGDPTEARDLRLEAGRRRLALYSEAGKKAEADAWAARLAKSGAWDAATLAAVAEYHQGAKRYAPATQYWRQAVRIREKDPSASAALQTQVYYRQLAYCYDRLGKAHERDAARAAAARLEVAHAPRK